RETYDQCHRCAYTVSAGAFDPFDCLDEVEILVHDFLQTLRARFNAKEDSSASGFGHKSQQVIVDAIRPSAATPRKLHTACNSGLTEFDHLFAIDRVHV